MSESHEHREMVLAMGRTLLQMHPNIQLVADVSSHMWNRQLPPMINNHRPDIFARNKEQVFIGEVKIFSDLETQRSLLQIRTFVQFAEKHKGNFILGVYGQGADQAKTLLRRFSDHLRLNRCQLHVFDGRDYWLFVPNARQKWRLI